MQTSPKAHRIEITLLAAITLLSRLYRINWHPLWVDELYSHQVSTQSLTVILRNSLYESHPPLYYILLKFCTLFNLWHSETGLRWLSAAAGTAFVIFVYWMAARLTDRPSARLCWALMVFSPTLIFYAQEARSYAVDMLLAAGSLWQVYGLRQREQPSRGQWIAWGAVSMVGVYAGYSYLLVLAAQALFLLWHFRRERAAWVTLCLIGLGIAPLIPLILRNLDHDIETVAIHIPLNAGFMTVALFAGEPARYGLFWGSYALPILAGAAVLIGCMSLARARDKFGGYLVLQVTFPLFVHFLIFDAIFGIDLPNYQSRQFLIILPALYLLAAHGFHALHTRLPRRASLTAAGVVLLVMAAGSLTALGQYWRAPKSPEAQAALLVRAGLQPGDTVVSIGQSLDAAAGYYLPPATLIYFAPIATDSGYRFDDNPLILRGQVTRRYPIAAEDLLPLPRLWLMQDRRFPQPAATLLLEGCNAGLQGEFGPFEVILLEDCSR